MSVTKSFTSHEYNPAIPKTIDMLLKETKLPTLMRYYYRHQEQQGQVVTPAIFRIF